MAVSLRLILLAIVSIKCARTEEDLVLISNPSREPGEFQMIARSRSTVIKEGSNIQLTCRTNQPWYLCSWVQPGGEECHRIVTDKYSTSCHSNDRISFQVRLNFVPVISYEVGKKNVIWKQGNERKEDCTIHLEDVQTSDSGQWECIVKDKVHADHKEVSTLEVTVARPYALYVEPQELELDLSEEAAENNGTAAEVICRAVGGGSVDPEVKWQLNGITQSEEASDVDQVVLLRRDRRPV